MAKPGATTEPTDEQMRALIEEVCTLSGAEHDYVYIIREQAWSPEGCSVTWNIQINQNSLSDWLGYSETLEEAMDKLRFKYGKKGARNWPLCKGEKARYK